MLFLNKVFFITGDITAFFVNVKDNLFECTLCHKIIKKSRNVGNPLKQHYEIMHTVGNKVNCPICKKVINHKYALSNHIFRKHKNNKIS